MSVRVGGRQLEAMLEPGLKSVDSRLDNGRPLLQRSVEPREVVFVHVFEVVAVASVHGIQPVDEFVCDFVSELFVESARKFCGDRHLLLQIREEVPS